MDLKKNDIIDLKITSMTAQGSGVGKTEDGIVIFVPNSAVGDELEVRVLKTKKTYAYGRIESVRSPSPDRIEPDCPVFFKCGGCVFRHISYEAELKIKYDRVRDALERIGGFKDIRLDAVVPNPRVNRYRNKAQLPALDGESVRLGFFANHSHRIIPLDGCFLQPELFDRVMKLTEEFMNETAQTAYDERTLKGRLRHLYIRYAEATGELMVCLVVNGNGLKQEDLLVKKLREQLPELTARGTSRTFSEARGSSCRRCRFIRSTELRRSGFTRLPRITRDSRAARSCLTFTAVRERSGLQWRRNAGSSSAWRSLRTP